MNTVKLQPTVLVKMNEVFDCAYAYSPRENTGSRGGYHLVTTQEIHIGRFHRQPGDALCKSRSKFWGLEGGRAKKLLNCKRCIELASKYGFETGKKRSNQ